MPACKVIHFHLHGNEAGVETQLPCLSQQLYKHLGLVPAALANLAFLVKADSNVSSLLHVNQYEFTFNSSIKNAS